MQSSRLFQMIYILLEKATVTAPELAERFAPFSPSQWRWRTTNQALGLGGGSNDPRSS